MSDELSVLLKIGSMFALSFFSFWPAIPAGLALGLSPIVIGITVTVSYGSGVLLVVLVGEPLRQRIAKRFGGGLPDENNPIRRAWNRFGLIGLSLLAPMTVGAQIGALVGLSLNVPRRNLVLWMTIGAAVWAVILTVGVLLGVLGVQAVS